MKNNCNTTKELLCQDKTEKRPIVWPFTKMKQEQLGGKHVFSDGVQGLVHWLPFFILPDLSEQTTEP